MVIILGGATAVSLKQSGGVNFYRFFFVKVEFVIRLQFQVGLCVGDLSYFPISRR